MKAVDITLLTRSEYDKYGYLLPSKRSRGWIIIGNNNETIIMDEKLDWKSLGEGYAYAGRSDMLPVVICDSIPYQPGSKIEFGGITWTVISESKMIANDSIGLCQPVPGTRTWPHSGPKISETKCIPFVQNWLVRHKKDPMYVLGKNKKTQIK